MAVAALTTNELERFIRSKPFRSRLAEAAIASQGEYETGFIQVRTYQEKQRDALSPVVEGGRDQVPFELYWPWIEEITNYNSSVHWAELFHLHFHPYSDAAFAPSRADLQFLNRRSNGPRNRPVIGIATIDDACHGSLLLMQRTIEGNLPVETLDQLDSRFDDLCYQWKDEDFGAKMGLPGLVRAECLRFSVPQNSRYAHLANPEIIRRFGYHAPER